MRITNIWSNLVSKKEKTYVRGNIYEPFPQRMEYHIISVITVCFLFVYYPLSEKILNCQDMAWIQKRFTIIVNSASK